MVSFKTLKAAAFDEILTCLKSAYPESWDKPGLQHQFRRDHINLELSVGAFDGNRMIGCLLYGDGHYGGVYSAYITAVGVVPGYRGGNLTRQMHESSLPAIKREGILQIITKVNRQRSEARDILEKIGYRKTRGLIGHTGKIEKQHGLPPDTIRLIDLVDWVELMGFWDWPPSWQNQAAAITRTLDKQLSLGYFAEGKLLGYIIFIPEQGIVSQFAVAKGHRRNGIGTALFSEAFQRCGPAELTCPDTDAFSEGPVAFFKKYNWETTERKTEMQLIL